MLSLIIVLFFALSAVCAVGLYYVEIKPRKQLARYREIAKRHIRVVQRIEQILMAPTESWLFTPAIGVMLHKKAARSLITIQDLVKIKAVPKSYFNEVSNQLMMHSSAAERALCELHQARSGNAQLSDVEPSWPSDPLEQRSLSNMILRLERIIHRVSAESISWDLPAMVVQYEIERLHALNAWVQCCYLEQDAHQCVLKGNLQVALRKFKDIVNISASQKSHSIWFSSIRERAGLHIGRMESSIEEQHASMNHTHQNDDGLDRFDEQKKIHY